MLKPWAAVDAPPALCRSCSLSLLSSPSLLLPSDRSVSLPSGSPDGPAPPAAGCRCVASAAAMPDASWRSISLSSCTAAAPSMVSSSSDSIAEVSTAAAPPLCCAGVASAAASAGAAAGEVAAVVVVFLLRERCDIGATLAAATASDCSAAGWALSGSSAVWSAG